MKKAIALFAALFLVIGMASAQDTITLTVEADSTGWGYVTGGGSYALGDTATIEAFPNVGYMFLYWNDSITDNPLDVILSQDSSFVAHFGPIDYTITTAADPENAGTVTEGGIYHYGDTITLEASPNLGFLFEMWDDSITDNPRDVVVTQDSSFTALFSLKEYTITGVADPEGAGYVEGDGIYHYGDTISLFAHSNTGYYFERWHDDNTDNPRQVVVKKNATYTASFRAFEYEVTTGSNPEEGGTVSGGGTYPYGETVTLTATANVYYTFLCWSDGIVTNPRNITVTQDTVFKAYFQFNGIPTYVIKAIPNDSILGTTEGSGVYEEGSIVEISATPTSLASFTSWDDGNTDNPRQIEVREDKVFVAMFEALPQYNITVKPIDPNMGTVYGSGYYPFQTVVTIGATPNEGYYFTGWDDGDMSNPRTIIVTRDATFVALFTATPVDTYSVTVYYDENQGIILGANTNYPAGAIASLAALPADGYVFVRWSDGTTDNPKEVVVDHDIVLAAFFNYTDVEENEVNSVSLYPNPANNKLHVKGLEDQHKILIYNAFGILVKTASLNGDGEIDIESLSAGFYLLRVDGQTMKFIKE